MTDEQQRVFRSRYRELSWYQKRHGTAGLRGRRSALVVYQHENALRTVYGRVAREYRTGDSIVTLRIHLEHYREEAYASNSSRHIYRTLRHLAELSKDEPLLAVNLLDEVRDDLLVAAAAQEIDR